VGDSDAEDASSLYKLLASHLEVEEGEDEEKDEETAEVMGTAENNAEAE
jgi:hypothetical protein